MSSFRSEPILWLHVAGLATLPIFLFLCLLFLSVGEPVLPMWMELCLVAAIGVLPLLWMQFRRPFYIFAILGVALKPENLTEQQRKILCLINTNLNRVLSVLAAILLVGVLWQMYQAAPLVADIASFLPQWRSVGLLLAALAFFASNLFLQIPVSVARILVTNDTEFAAIEPLPLDKIQQDYTIVGVRVNQILPRLFKSVLGINKNTQQTLEQNTDED
ncbi:low-complexity tail membrane protein [Tolypothrix sp. PCC 7910]|uniref:low-complexity tail membrane protein n=1 Tax=Tolypothrix sp. PCC 7910 TaxID=2099387 RepID=UPI0014279236|nr:low-complexity tail membrane protein [Tolypothrix sp. PCC 7910]QIR37627.1 low-complexity tail membrane protein [Tolypothrix sp. PCC 7910]